jgi:transposase-like protein
MSELLSFDRHNYSNPACVYCGGLTSKNGKIKRVHGRVQRFICTKCGRTFQIILEEELNE